jgi:hypothetical protein
MTWVRLDDAMLDHPKVARLSPLGLAQHVAGIVWSSRNLTDGILPRRVVNRLLDWEGIGTSMEVPADASEDIIMALRVTGWSSVNKELLPGGLWHDAESAESCSSAKCHEAPPPKEDELLIHDFLDYQRPKGEILAERNVKRSQRVAAGKARAASAGRAAGQFTSEEPAKTPANDQHATSPVPVPVPVPERQNNLAPLARVDAFFEAFYKLYPRKKDRGHALTAYKAALRKTEPGTIQAGLERALPEFAARPADKVPYPATWLRGEGWLDSPDPTSNGAGPVRDPRNDLPSAEEALRSMGYEEGQDAV